MPENDATAEVTTEILTLTGQPPATHQHNAFFGRIVFHTRFPTLGDQSQMQTIYDGILATGALNGTRTDANGKPLLDEKLADAAADLAAWLVLTSALEFGADRDHPEIRALYDFWRWWVAQEQPPDYAALWAWRLRLGWSSAEEWKRAYAGAQATALRAPRPLLPDSLLTEAERTDPQPESVGSKQEKRSDAG